MSECCDAKARTTFQWWPVANANRLSMFTIDLTTTASCVLVAQIKR